MMWSMLFDHDHIFHNTLKLQLINACHFACNEVSVLHFQRLKYSLVYLDQYLDLFNDWYSVVKQLFTAGVNFSVWNLTFVAQNREQAASYIPALFHLKIRAPAHMVLPVITRRLSKSIGQILMTRQDPVNAPGCGLEWQNTLKKNGGLQASTPARPTSSVEWPPPPHPPTTTTTLTSTPLLSHFTLALAQWQVPSIISTDWSLLIAIAVNYLDLAKTVKWMGRGWRWRGTSVDQVNYTTLHMLSHKKGNCRYAVFTLLINGLKQEMAPSKPALW